MINNECVERSLTVAFKDVQDDKPKESPLKGSASIDDCSI